MNAGPHAVTVINKTIVNGTPSDNNIDVFNFVINGNGSIGDQTVPSKLHTYGASPSATPTGYYATIVGVHVITASDFPFFAANDPKYKFPPANGAQDYVLDTDASHSNESPADNNHNKHLAIITNYSYDTWAGTSGGNYWSGPYTTGCTAPDAPTFGTVVFDLRGGIKPDPENHFGCSGSSSCSNCSGGNPHMAGASLDRFQAGIAITDTPVTYTPGVGMAMNFTLHYHQRQTNQPTTFNFSNLGEQWNANWIAYIGDGPTNASASATYHAPDGTQYTYGSYQPAIASGVTVQNQGDFLANDGWTHATLHYRQGPERYERWLSDGTIEKYALAVGTSPNRLFFLSSITDPQGNVTSLAYDPAQAKSGNAVLNSVTDPTGGQLAFSYNSAGSNPFLISKVTRTNDGLSAKFLYTNGQLTSISDTIGITSSFHYTAGTNFIDTMTTPYGTWGLNSTDGAGYLEADITNPLGDNERVEYQEALSSSLFPTPADGVPPTPNGNLVAYDNLQTADTFYWTRRAMAQAAGLPDSSAGYKLAQVTHWAEGPQGSLSVPLSTKMPLEGRIWYNYPAQTGPDTVDLTAANATTSPSLTARLLDDGTTQYSSATYTASGLIATSIDPKGRTTNYSYDLNNNIDLTKVTQTNSASSTGVDVLSTMTYNQGTTVPLHVPIAVTDASGQTTRMQYYTNGLLNTRTVTVGGVDQVTTLTYWPSTWYLKQVAGPISGANINYSYNTSGRVHSVTDSENYTVTTLYDKLDRPTTVTYPDGTSDQTIYNKLDVYEQIDRQNRTTYNYYDAIRELLQTTDPQGRGTWYSWCKCGGLSTLTDANGSLTSWGLDLQGRVTSKTYAGHTSPDISYVYETNISRLHSMTDANGNISTYSYNSDNTLGSTSYTLGTGVAATANVSFTYDTAYNRVLTMLDGTGTTTYAYNSVTVPPTLGAGRLATITSPVYGTSHTATISYNKSDGTTSGYDELGRAVGWGIDQTTTNANNVSTTFDALGRVTNVTNALGSFTYAYVNQTSRLQTVTDPVGTGGTGQSLTTTYIYYPVTNTAGAQDGERLQEIKNLQGTTPLSDFLYSYNPVGTIATWQTQVASNTAVVNTMTYDNADQLTKALQSGGGSASNTYGYDPAGNRLTEKTASTTKAGQFNNLNQLTGFTSSSTSLTVAGHTSGAVSSLTIDAVPTTITNNTNFTANVSMPSGTNTVSLVAQPANGPIATQRYQIVASGTAPTDADL